ncbi:hypothetical protein FSP39_009012 [Pinctada imbricata]|uniref:All-trans-retinol 13,14-reductase n=1 Tax=Pinctada imbricata TaxID=66713 RepID=A0AA88XF35_PINIB|nr:hypothetical protein FSP39_009012 [Pinctada imbricata]
MTNTGVLSFVENVINYVLGNPYLLATLILLYIFIFALSVLFSGPKPGKNPFSQRHVRPVGKLVTDQSIRDKVLKQRFKTAKVPENLDAIIIGSGIGGLSAAVLLSRAGKKVLVLEQHDQAGGCCHTFHDKGFEFDTGVHYIGKMHKGATNRIFMDQLTGGAVEYPLMDEDFDIVALGNPAKARRYPIPASREKYQERLIAKFPKEEAAIKKFMKMLKDAEGFALGYVALKMAPKWLAKLLVITGLYKLIFKPYAKYSTLTLRKALDDMTDDDELKAVMCYIWGDYGVLPTKASFGLHSMLMNHYFEGAYYIRGGPTEIVLQMIPVIENYGGRVLVNAPVSEILMSAGRAVGVKLRKGESEVDIFARNIISDAGVSNTFKRLLPKEVATKSCIYPMLQKVGESLSYITLFVGLNGTKEELGIKAHNCWSHTRLDQENAAEEFIAMSLDDAVHSEFPIIFVSFPSAKDPNWHDTNPDKSTCLVITLSPYKWFSQWENERVKNRGDDYERYKQQISHQIWEQTCQLYPQLQDKVEYMDLGTPVSNRYYLGFQQGEMYGLDHAMQRFLPEAATELRAKTDIPGLFLTGQDIMTCGLTGALYGGLFCAGEILHRNLYNDLMALRKEIKKQQ